MKIHKQFRRLENVEEISIYDVNEKEFYTPTPQEFKVEKIPVKRLMRSIPLDIHTLVPYNNGEDFIIQSLGNTTIKRGEFKQSDVEGRRLSKISPVIYRIIGDCLREVYKTDETKKLRFQYYLKDNIKSITNAKIIHEMGRVFVIQTIWTKHKRHQT